MSTVNMQLRRLPVFRICAGELPTQAKAPAPEKEDIEQFLLFVGNEGYADEAMQIRAMELSKQRLEQTAETQQRELIQKCRLSVGLGAMSGLLLLILLV